MAKREQKLKVTTVWLMIATALFFDTLQILLDFVFMGWLVTIFASLTYYVWFKSYGYSFWRPKRLAGSFATFLIDLVPFIGSLAWTVAISTFALKNKFQSVVPGSEITKLDIMKR